MSDTEENQPPQDIDFSLDPEGEAGQGELAQEEAAATESVEGDGADEVDKKTEAAAEQVQPATKKGRKAILTQPGKEFEEAAVSAEISGKKLVEKRQREKTARRDREAEKRQASDQVRRGAKKAKITVKPKGGRTHKETECRNIKSNKNFRT